MVRDFAQRREAWLKAPGSEAIFALVGSSPLIVDGNMPEVAEASQQAIVVPFRLQHASDYRAAIRGWFGLLAFGGRLVIAVPHAFLDDRQFSLPSRRDPTARRLYTPRVLLDEVEEALNPNSYRVRYLADHDEGYEYDAVTEASEIGASDIVLVLERIVPPSWELALIADEPPHKPYPSSPDYAFVPPTTRVEVGHRLAPRRVLLLKPDHLGDFIMSLPALKRARAVFPDAELTLLCGSWNADMARELSVADHVIPFDMFPRNSTEEEPDVAGKADLFRAVVTEEYDLAIDLRLEHDVRPLLRHVRAGLRAGIGTHEQFPYLDIFLPIDGTRNEPGTAREYRLSVQDFPTQGSAERTAHRVFSAGATVERDCAIVWGPYWQLRPGNYIFEPFVDIHPGATGLLKFDIAIDAHSVHQLFVEGPTRARLPFALKTVGDFEFRIWTVDAEPAPDFSFYGGRLIRAGAAAALHQSEYMLLLVELVAMRLNRTGSLSEMAT